MKKRLMCAIVTAAVFSAASMPVMSQVQTQDVSVIALEGPASDSADTLNYTRLPKGFPVIGEMKLSALPLNCGLSKVNRSDASLETPVKDFASHYVFMALGMDETMQEPIYQIAVNGILRQVKETGRADEGDQEVRYFKTFDGPDVEVMVAIKPTADGTQKTGIFGRIKAWDDDLPLMCGYNRIEVIGDCDL